MNANRAWLGAGNLGGGNHGVTDGQDWVGALANANPGGDVDMRILLDTTGGSGAWTATWLAKRPTETDYTVVRPATSVLDESNFTSVGFAFANAGVSGSIESFSLTQLPEPGAAMLLVSALVCGLLWRRRRGKK